MLIQIGEIFGVFSFFTGEAREATLISKDFSSIMEINKHDFLSIISNNKEDFVNKHKFQSLF